MVAWSAVGTPYASPFFVTISNGSKGTRPRRLFTEVRIAACAAEILDMFRWMVISLNSVAPSLSKTLQESSGFGYSVAKPARHYRLRGFTRINRRRTNQRGSFWALIALRCMAVSTATLVTWEHNHSNPELKYRPKILEFLGYDPCAHTGRETLAEQIRSFRLRNGITQRELGQMLDVNGSTVSNWDTKSKNPWRHHGNLILLCHISQGANKQIRV
jgi:DNA-binding transcriptional regulator YiaG